MYLGHWDLDRESWALLPLCTMSSDNVRGGKENQKWKNTMNLVQVFACY